MQAISSQFIRQFVLIVIILLLISIIFWELKIFLPSFLGAYTLYILLRKPHFYLTVKRKWSPIWSTMSMIMITLIVLVIPAWAIVKVISSRIQAYLQSSKEIFSYLEQFSKDLENRLGFDIISDDSIVMGRDWLVQEGGSFLSATLNSIAILLIMYFLLYYLMMNSKTIERRLTGLLPLDQKVSEQLKKHLNSMVFSNAVGVPLVALVQSLVAMAGYLIAGVSEPFLWTFMTFIASFIPIIGSMIIYLPLSIVLLYNGNESYGVFLFLYCFILVGSVDNVFRFWLQDKIGNTHPLITIFGVIIGIKLFGFLGLIFGPILISSLILLIDLYAKQYTQTNAT